MQKLNRKDLFLFKNYLKALKILFIGALLFFLFPSYLLSQNSKQKIDSLLTLMKDNKEDTNKVIHLYNLSYEYSNISSYDSAFYYGNAAVLLAKQLNFKKGIASSYIYIGEACRHQSNYSEALKNCFHA